jgi:hypothetical protein
MEGTKDPRVRLLCETIQRLEELRTEAKNTASDYRERIQTIEAEVRVLAEEIRTGQKTLFDDKRSGDAAAKLAETVAGILPRRAGIDSVTFSSPGTEPVTLDQRAAAHLRKAAKTLRARAR